MKYATVCSGIEAPSVAWEPLGWEPVFFSEIEPFPSAVLAHRYPGVPNRGDMTRFQEWPDAAFDVLCGGTPCQSFSVAGLRKGLADPRGNNLALVFLAIAARTRPRWLLWENVPGVLSSHGGRDFGSFLGALGELGYGWAYRVLDAQFFGVPQRRRRVFVVGHLGDWRRAAAVLFERHSLQGHPPPRRETGARTSERTARSVAIRGRDGTPQAELGDDKANAILTPNGGRAGVGCGAVLETVETYPCLRGGNAYNNSDPGMEAQMLVPVPILEAGKRCGAKADLRDGIGVGEAGDPMFKLQAGAQHAIAYQCHGSNVGEMGTLRAGNGDTTGGVPFVTTPNHPFLSKRDQRVAAIAFDPTQITSGENRSNPRPGAPCHTLAKGQHAPAIAFHATQDPISGDVTPCMGGGNKQGCGSPATMTRAAVRRLTPRECERLQGFPDDYTLIPFRGKPATDGPRYKALGNPMAVPVVRWLGRRIALVHALALPGGAR